MAAAFSIAPSLAAAVELAGDASKEDIYSLLNTTEDDVLNKKEDRRGCVLIGSSVMYGGWFPFSFNIH